MPLNQRRRLIRNTRVVPSVYDTKSAASLRIQVMVPGLEHQTHPSLTNFVDDLTMSQALPIMDREPL
jgi:hypothetical protein